MPYGMSMGRGNTRNPSFDEGPGMLPPSVMDAQDPSNPNFSPYSQTSSNGLVSQHQPWQYMSMPEMYNNQQVSPLQPRPTHQMPMGYPMAQQMAQQMQQMRPMNPYGAYFPACSPGPPIQTTASNKGYVLFIFRCVTQMLVIALLPVVSHCCRITLFARPTDPREAICLSFTFPTT